MLQVRVDNVGDVFSHFFVYFKAYFDCFFP